MIAFSSALVALLAFAAAPIASATIASVTPVEVSAPAYVSDPSLTLNIGTDKTMTVTGSGYPPSSTVSIELKDLNTGNAVTITKETDSNGVLQPAGTSQGTLTVHPGDVVQASTPAPYAATTTAVVPGTPRRDPHTGEIIKIILKILDLIP